MISDRIVFFFFSTVVFLFADVVSSKGTARLLKAIFVQYSGRIVVCANGKRTSKISTIVMMMKSKVKGCVPVSVPALTEHRRPFFTLSRLHEEIVSAPALSVCEKQSIVF